ncbi:MAG: alanine racemase [Candidatus Krumholzibacteriia bacterium]
MPARTRKPAPTASGIRPSRPPAEPGRPAWLTIDVDGGALRRNMQVFRELVAPPTRLLAVVKSDAYGHGIAIAARAFLAGGADILGVHSVAEARALRTAGLEARVIVLGPALAWEAAEAGDLGVELTVGSLAAAEAVAEAGSPLRVHLKVETGVNRQGLVEAELAPALALLGGVPGLKVVGLSSHFADMEDTTDHGFAEAQLARFAGHREHLRGLGLAAPEVHMSCSAAVLLFDRTHADIARVGVSAYGIWPSRETRVSVRQRGRAEPRLEPALTWRVTVAQVRDVPAGQTVGYGRTWKAMTDSRIAVLPVGYADGWPRALSGRAHVLVRGRRAPVVGRICMNLCMVDVTHVPEAAAGDQAVLLGRQSDEVITAEMLADQLGTIAYEVLTLPGATWTRCEL